MIVYLLGADRSGTSFTAGCLYHLGAYFGGHMTRESNAMNPRGFFENNLAQEITNVLHDIIEPVRRDRHGLANKLFWKYLSRGKGKWYKYHTFFDDPDWRFPSNRSLDDVDVITLAAMERLLDDLDRGGVGVIKVPGMIYSFPFWRSLTMKMGLDFKIVAVFRNPAAVARSMKGLAVNEGLPVRSERDYIKDWSIKNRLLLEWVDGAGKDGVEVLWSNFDWDGEYMLKRLEENCGALGLVYDDARVRGFFDPGLRHHEASIDFLDDDNAKRIYRELLKRSGSPRRFGEGERQASGGGTAP